MIHGLHLQFQTLVFFLISVVVNLQIVNDCLSKLQTTFKAVVLLFKFIVCNVELIFNSRYCIIEIFSLIVQQCLHGFQLHCLHSLSVEVAQVGWSML